MGRGVEGNLIETNLDRNRELSDVPGDPGKNEVAPIPGDPGRYDEVNIPVDPSKDIPQERPGLEIPLHEKGGGDAGKEKSDVAEKKGGSYKEVKENSEGDTHEVHHMPADSVSPLEYNDGPAIKMEKEDHRKTASCGNSKEAREYRAQQQKLIEQGKFREALQMDIDDICDKFGDKYDDAIAEMMEYVDKLEQEDKLNG